MNQLLTRQQKLRFLKDLQSGKASMQSIAKPGTAVLFIEGGKVFAHQTRNEHRLIEPPVDLDEYEQQAGTYSHKVIIEDYSYCKQQ